MQIDKDVLKTHIREELINCKANSCPMAVRLAWHSAGTYDPENDKKGGTNGSTMRFKPESSDLANKGLEISQNILSNVIDKHKKLYKDLSLADLWVAAGASAIEFTGGPKIEFSLGRTDDNDGIKCPENGRLPNALRGATHLREVFYRMGFSDKEIVALSGAHTIGRCHMGRSGFDGPWTKKPLKFDNEYFKNLLELTWVKKTLKNGQMQYEDKETGKLMMLPTDIALIKDNKFKKYVEIYAENENIFFADFAAAYSKLLQNGVDVKEPVNDDTKENEFLLYCMHGSLDRVKEVLSMVDINVVEKFSGRSGLHKASFWGHIEIVKFLVESGININIKDIDGDTALDDCKRNGHTKIIAYLESKYRNCPPRENTRKVGYRDISRNGSIYF